MDTLDVSSMVMGRKYRLHTRIGQQKYTREHLLTYLGRGGSDGKGLMFNARPFAGTQEFRAEEIVAMWDQGPSSGRDSSDHYMNKVLNTRETRVF